MQQPKLYRVTLESGTNLYLLASCSEQAAWSALELSEESGDNLVNVQLAPEWS